MGINLTSADVCMFHDIDWNPEMDRQVKQINNDIYQFLT